MTKFRAGALGIAVSAATAVLLTLTPSGAPAAGAATPQVTEFATSVDSPRAITKGPDGNLWFEGDSGLGKISPAGAATRITGVPNVAAHDAGEIASGPDGDIWFTTFKEGSGAGLGKINPTTLAYTEYSVGEDCGTVQGIVPGPDGRLWFACDDSFEGHIGAITTGGTISFYSTGYPTSYNGDPGAVGLAVGSDGDIWFITRTTFGKVTTAGAVTVYNASLSGPPLGGIAAGPDGNLWIAETGANYVAKVTTGGPFTEYPAGQTGTDAGGPWAIAAGPDGNLWFTNGAPVNGDVNEARIGKMTTSGVVTDYGLTAGVTTDSQPDGITAGPDGNIWFTEEAGRIGRFDLHAATSAPPPTTTTPTPKPAAAHTASIVVRVIGKGKVAGSGINCPGACTKTFSGSQSTTVALHANAASGYHLSAWSGGVCQSAAWKLLLTAKAYGTCTLSRIHWDGEAAAWDWGSAYAPSTLPRRANLALTITATFVKGR